MIYVTLYTVTQRIVVIASRNAVTITREDITVITMTIGISRISALPSGTVEVAESWHRNPSEARLIED